MKRTQAIGRVLLAAAACAALGACSPGGPEELLDVGRLEEMQDDPAAARRAYERVIAAYPDSTQANEARKRLRAMGGEE